MKRITSTAPTTSAHRPSRTWQHLMLLFAGVLVMGFLAPPTASATAAQLMALDAVVVEDNAASAVRVRIVLAQRQDHRITVRYTTVDGGAKAGLDYDAVSGRVVFPVGTRVQRVLVPIIDDALDERDEAFRLRIFAAVGADIADRSARVTIVDEDPAPTVSVGDVSATEPDSGSTTMAVPVTLSAPSGRFASVAYTVTAGTATAGSDYVAAAGGRLYFPAGTTSRTIEVTVLGDTVQEAAETLSVTLSEPVHLTVGDGVGVGTINESDLPVMSVADTSVNEGDTAQLTVSLSKPTTLPVTFDYGTANGTAVAGTDYKATTASAKIEASHSSVKITVPTIEDVTDEPDEDFFVSLSNIHGASLADGQAKVVIHDDDAPSVVSVADTSAVEGKDMVFGVSLSKVSGFDVKVDWATSDGTAKSPGDYLPDHGTLTIPAGHSSGQVTVGTVQDAADEGNETFGLTLSKPERATIGDGAAVATILDDDGPTVSVEDITLAEGQDAVFTVKLSKTSPQEVRVDWATSNGTAKSPGDYTAAHGTAVVPPNTSSVTFAVITVDDLLDEAPETFAVDLSNPKNATIGDGHAVATLTDNDNPPSLSIADKSVNEGDDAVLTVTLSSASGQEVRVVWATQDGTAKANGDYTGASGTLTIPAGSTSGTITVDTGEDHAEEPDLYFTVLLTSPVNATITDSSATVTIRDDD